MGETNLNAAQMRVLMRDPEWCKANPKKVAKFKRAEREQKARSKALAALVAQGAEFTGDGQAINGNMAAMSAVTISAVQTAMTNAIGNAPGGAAFGSPMGGHGFGSPGSPGGHGGHGGP